MNKILTLVLLSSLIGCSSTDKHQAEFMKLKNQVESLDSKVDETDNMVRSGASFSPGDAYGYENARLKRQIQIMDEGFSSEIRALQKKIFETEQLLEFQIIRIESLEDDRPIVEPMDPKKPSFRKPK